MRVRTNVAPRGKSRMAIAGALLATVAGAFLAGCKGASLADPDNSMLANTVGTRERNRTGIRVADMTDETPAEPATEPPAEAVVEPPAETPDAGPPAAEKPLVPRIPIPKTPKLLVVDRDYIYAIVNGEVVSIKDVRRDVAQRLDVYDLNIKLYSTPWSDRSTDLISYAEYQDLRANFYRKALQILYRQRAEELRKRLGSIPREQIDKAIAETKLRHGIVGDGPEAQRRWEDVLRRSNLTYFDFEQQIRDQIESTRVVQFLAYAPDERLGISFDITPEEMQREYARNPIEATKNIELLRVRFPLIVDSQAEKDRELKRANDFVTEVNRRFEQIDRRYRTNREEWAAARRAGFLELAKAYFPDFSATPETLTDLADEKPEVATEIRRTPAGEISTSVSLTDEIVIIFLISKEQAGLEPFTSPAVQNELQRRLLNRRWNDFRQMVDKRLFHEATIISTEAGIIELDK